MRRYDAQDPWITGTDAIRARFVLALALALALADVAVRAILLDTDSIGGVVAGIFDLVDAIAAARGIKPVWAVLDEKATPAPMPSRRRRIGSPSRAPAAPDRSGSRSCTRNGRAPWIRRGSPST